ncbi:MAG: peptidoglycan DD-metalloendopeptidase family protein [Wenzhouxiangellaceae bacterium]|nr:peptidoglycan DD-metalloendopeptidase family protein [Wenzhouxiangellaceae bacterium]
MPRNRPMASRRAGAGKPGLAAPDLAAVRRHATDFLGHCRRLAARLHGRRAMGGTMAATIAGTIAALAILTIALQFGGVRSGPVEPEGGTVAEVWQPEVVPPVESVTDEAGMAAVESEADTAAAPLAGTIPAETTPAVAEPVRAAPAWKFVRVARGDTMEIIFRKLGLSPRLLHEIVHLDDRSGSLVDLRPGDKIAFDLREDGTFNALRSEFDDENWLFVEQAETGLASRLEPRALEARIVEADAEITSSLFNAGKQAGLSDNMILRLAGIFGWDIDFALDIRRGDRFALVYEEIWRDGEFLRQGAILGARFINQGKSFEAVRFDPGSGPDYYDPEGRPMRKQFLRAPLNFTRVTSNFNPRRFHPVTRRVRPHNGTDYGAATGTPVWASGDGTVIEAGYGRANGNYIFVKHGNHIVTRYLHLSKKLVGRGDRVRQGQTIGRVGATGLATGPHLHYEFLVNGRHRDPRKVDLPEATPLPDDILPDFRASTSEMFAQLDELLPPKVLLAGTNTEAGPGSNSGARAATAPE